MKVPRGKHPCTATRRARPRLLAWQSEREAFERLRPRLERRYRDRWVAICDGRIVASGADYGALLARMWSELGDRAFFIGRVGDPEPPARMPGFEVE